MLTIVDKPLIQYVVDEAKEAGIEHFIFVTGRNKAVIEDHFDRMFELDATLAARGNKKAEQDILARDQPEAGATSSPASRRRSASATRLVRARHRRRRAVRGGAAGRLVLNSAGLPGADDRGCRQTRGKSNLLAVEAVPDDLTHQYGICGVGKRHAKNMFEVDDMVEKPPKGTAPSNFSITGRYILQPEISRPWRPRSAARQRDPAHRCDGLPRQDAKLLRRGVRGRAARLRLETGAANIAYGMARPDLRDGLRAKMKKYPEN